jgi:hypothetical protein
LKSAYPEKAEKLRAMQVGTAESEIERLARISVNMGIRPSSTTSDSMSNMATEERNWIRPGFFTEEKDDAQQRAVTVAQQIERIKNAPKTQDGPVSPILSDALDGLRDSAINHPQH